MLRTVNAGNYKTTVGITQRGERLELGGRINFGPKCNKLLIRCSVLSNYGQTKSFSVMTNYSGFGSQLYDSQQRVSVDYSRGFPLWDITQVVISCND